MGCGAGKEAPVVNVDAGDWNAAYNKTLNKGGMIIRQATSSLEDPPDEVVFKEGRIAEINGFAIIKTLGKGAFGEVFLARKGNQEVAVKCLKQEKLKKQGMPGRPGKTTTSALDSVKVARFSKVTFSPWSSSLGF